MKNQVSSKNSPRWVWLAHRACNEAGGETGKENREHIVQGFAWNAKEFGLYSGVRAPYICHASA